MMSHVFVAHFPLCPMLILRNPHVPCHFIFQANVVILKACVTLSSLRNAHVTLSILRVEGHTIITMENRAEVWGPGWRCGESSIAGC